MSKENPHSPRFDRFARAHLPTTADRTVYPVLASDPGQDWTARDVAKHTGLSHQTVDQVLRRFAAAGIVSRSHQLGRPPRYRWQPEMGYLRSDDAESGPVDPVCGMPVSADSDYTAHHGETTYLFCSLPCLVRWRSSLGSPERPRQAQKDDWAG